MHTNMGMERRLMAEGSWSTLSEVVQSRDGYQEDLEGVLVPQEEEGLTRMPNTREETTMRPRTTTIPTTDIKRTETEGEIEVEEAGRGTVEGVEVLEGKREKIGIVIHEKTREKREDGGIETGKGLMTGKRPSKGCLLWRTTLMVPLVSRKLRRRMARTSFNFHLIII